MAKSLIVGNWKMHFNVHQASLLLHKLEHRIDVHRDVEVVLAPNLLVLQSLSLQVKRRQFKLAAQNCYWRDEGAFTGEVSATMLRGVVDYVIVGHSERRHVFGERDADIRHKVQAVLRNNMTPILCVGETASERVANETHHVLHAQVTAGLSNVTSEEIENLVIAYEPVWAIGTGKAATPDDVAKVVSIIRKQINSLYGKTAAEKIRILYGGSVDNHNASAFLATKDVNGLLVGGASLNAEVFTGIVVKAHEQRQKEV
jgi:triosephosphate isomerase